jgi:hypothetical protein
MSKGHPFAMLLSDLEATKRLQITSSARADYKASLTPEGEFEGDVLEIDLAPLLGLDPAPHRGLKLSNLSAVGLFQLSEAHAKLWRIKKLAGWPEALCRDVSLLCLMHKAPDWEESGKSRVDMYGMMAESLSLRRLYLYLLERVGRAFPDLVRPELRMEIMYNDLRYDMIAAGKDPDEITPEQYDQDAEEMGVLPNSEFSPNASAGSPEERSHDTRLNSKTSPLVPMVSGTGRSKRKTRASKPKQGVS